MGCRNKKGRVKGQMIINGTGGAAPVDWFPLVRTSTNKFKKTPNRNQYIQQQLMELRYEVNSGTEKLYGGFNSVI